MSKICPLFSGSTGNSTYIETKNGGLLIDAGTSFKSLNLALQNIGCCYENIKTIAVTHTHADHISGLKPVLRKTGATLTATEKTLEYLDKKALIPAGINVVVINEKGLDIDGIKLNCFKTVHDAEGSCGFTMILPDGKKFSICTDLGIVTDEVRNALDGSYAVLIESNHDVEMLKNGFYPPQTKVRILSDKGHISNNVCASEVLRLFENGTNRFILGHLSLNNNTPVLARSASEAALMDIGAKNGRDYILSVAGPKGNGVTVV